MESYEVYRYFWTRVTDRAARAASSKAAVALMQQLDGGAVEASDEMHGSRAWKNLKAQAREYLGPGIEQTIKIVVARSRSPVQVELVYDKEATMSVGGIEVSIATMPSTYQRADAVAWISNPVGQVWALGASACRLMHAVATRAT